MKNKILLLIVIATIISSCKKENIEPSVQKKVESRVINKKNEHKDTTVSKNDTTTTLFNKSEPVIDTPVVSQAFSNLSNIDINFLINPGFDSEHLTFNVINTSYSTITSLTVKNLIAVNTEEWACMDATNTPLYYKITRVSSTYKDNSFIADKSYHLYVIIKETSEKTHDFTFNVDVNGKIYNLQTQNLTYVKNTLGAQIDDVDVKCNKIIVNYRKSTESPVVFNR